MITITMKNGNVARWKKKEYTDYTYDGKYFIVIYHKKWVGFYNLDSVKTIVVE